MLTKFMRPGSTLGLLALLVCGAMPLAAANTIYVSTSGSDSYDGSSWALAKRSVQAGINAASAYDQVWVAAGTYTAITLKDTVAIYGGFAGAETSLAQRNWNTNLTILDGNRSAPVVQATGVGVTTALDGFTVRNGSAVNGAGLFLSGASPLLENDTITSNRASNSGGGIYCTSASPLLFNVTVRNNSAAYGGGIFCYNGAAPNISRCVIVGNQVSGNGGGIDCNGASPTVVATTLKGNNAQGNGGGLYADTGSRPVVASCFIVWNNALDGGGIGLRGSSATLKNNTLVGNSATSQANGGGISLSSPTNGASSPVVANNIVALNSTGILRADNRTTPTLSHNCVSGNIGAGYQGMSAGATDITVSPQFSDTVYGDYHLATGSLCIDAGDNTYVAAGDTDIDGQTRLVGTTVDIGANEYHGAHTPAATRLVYYVSTAGNDTNSGLSWGQAKRTISAGLTSAAMGDIVWVATGTYGEGLTLKPNVALYGGFAGDEIALQERNPLLNPTGLNSGGLVVVTATGLGATTLLDGFLLSGGPSTLKSGIVCTGASPSIQHNTVIWNAGSGIYCDNASPVIFRNNISANLQIGIVCVNGSAPLISANSITENQHNYNAGGIYCESSSPLITGNTIAKNTCTGPGGGIYCSGASPTIVSNIIAGNVSPDGAGLSLYGSSPTIVNNTFVGNTTTGNAGAVIRITSAFFAASSPLIANCIFASNAALSVSRAGTQGYPQAAANCFFHNSGADYSGVSPGAGDLHTDPLFVDPGAENYHISLYSPCRNLGNVQDVPAGSVDIDGQARLRAGFVDIGADAFSAPCDFTGNLRSDLVWQNQNTGFIAYYEMNGLQPTGRSGFLVDAAPLAWRVAAITDLTGDGSPDLILQNKQTGEVIYDEIVAGRWTGRSGSLAKGIPLEWQVVGAADLDHDGKPDLIWQNSRTGEITYWQLNGTQVTGVWNYISADVPSYLRVAAVADLVGKGETDLLLQNEFSGDVTYLQLVGPFSTGYTAFITTGQPIRWRLIGAADMTGSGQQDLIWQDQNTGDVIYSQLHGTRWTGNSGYLSRGLPLEWQLVGPH